MGVCTSKNKRPESKKEKPAEPKGKEKEKPSEPVVEDLEINEEEPAAIEIKTHLPYEPMKTPLADLTLAQLEHLFIRSILMIQVDDKGGEALLSEEAKQQNEKVRRAIQEIIEFNCDYFKSEEDEPRMSLSHAANNYLLAPDTITIRDISRLTPAVVLGEVKQTVEDDGCSDLKVCMPVPTQFKTLSASPSKASLLWNPLLILVAKNEKDLVHKLICSRTAESLHLSSLLSKPYSFETQKERAFSRSKMIKRQAFALKLAIYNRSPGMLRLLLNGEMVDDECPSVEYDDCDQLTQIWNLGHILEAIRQILKTDQPNLLKTLMSLRRVKQLVMSLTDPESYFTFFSELLQAVFGGAAPSEEMTTAFLSSLDHHPYFLLKIMIQLQMQAHPDHLEPCFKKLERIVSLDKSYVSMYSQQVGSLLDLFDPLDVHSAVKDRLQEIARPEGKSLGPANESPRTAYEQKIKHRLLQISFDLKETLATAKKYNPPFSVEQLPLSEKFNYIKNVDQKVVNQIIDDLDSLSPFAFNPFNSLELDPIPKRGAADTNLALQLIELGNEEIIDHLYSRASDCNLRCLLSAPQDGNQSYKFSLYKASESQLPHALPLSLDYFAVLLQHNSIEPFKMSLQYVIDQMELEHVLQIMLMVSQQQEHLGFLTQMSLLTHVLKNPKFRCLFNCSLEKEKLAFTEGLMKQIIEDDENYDQAYLSKHDLKKLNGLVTANAEVEKYANLCQLPARLQKLKDSYKFKRSLLPPTKLQGPLKLPQVPELTMAKKKKKKSPRPSIQAKRKSIDSSQIETKLEISKVSSGVKPSNQTFGANEMKTHFENLQGNISPSDIKNKPMEEIEDEEEDISHDSIVIHQQVKELKGNANKFKAPTSQTSGDATQRQKFEQDDSSQEEVNVGGVKLHFPILDEERKSKKSIASKKSLARRKSRQRMSQSGGGMQLNMNNLIVSQKLKQMPTANTESEGQNSEMSDGRLVDAQIGQHLMKKEVGGEVYQEGFQEQLHEDQPSELTDLKSDLNNLQEKMLINYNLDNASAKVQLQRKENMTIRELDQEVPLYSEIAMAFSELLSGMSQNSLPEDEIIEVMETYCMSPFVPVQLNPNATGGAENEEPAFMPEPHQEMWNLMLFALKFNCQDIALSFFEREELSLNGVLAPPRSQDQIHLVPSWGVSIETLAFGEFAEEQVSHLGFYLICEHQSKPLLLEFLDKFSAALTQNDLFEMALILVRAFQWEEGLLTFLTSPKIKAIYEHFRPEEKHLLLVTILLDSFQFQDPMISKLRPRINQEKLLRALCSAPYATYAVLSNPRLFITYRFPKNLLLSSLPLISPDDLIVFLNGSEGNLQVLLDFQRELPQFQSSNEEEQGHVQLFNQFVTKAGQIVDNNILIEPNPQTPEFVRLIKKEDEATVIQLYKQLVASNTHMFKCIGVQIAKVDQLHDVESLPQDEAIQQLLFGTDSAEIVAGLKGGLNESLGSQDMEMYKDQILSTFQERVILSEGWNPLIFAIYFGLHQVVEKIFEACLSGEDGINNLHYLLTDPFRIDEPDDEEQQDSGKPKGDFLLERTELVPLVVCMLTKNVKMFVFLWEQPTLWRKPIHLIFMANFVIETYTPSLIKAFLTSEKTSVLFNQISWAEKKKFVDFIVQSLSQIILDNESQYEESDDEATEWAEIQSELQQILNFEFLAKPPFSLVNLSVNLVPVTLQSTVSDLQAIASQYNSSPESLKVLKRTVKNLRGGEGTRQQLYRWELLNQNIPWIKQLVHLLRLTQDDEAITKLKVLSEIAGYAEIA